MTKGLTVGRVKRLYGNRYCQKEENIVTKCCPRVRKPKKTTQVRQRSDPRYCWNAGFSEHLSWSENISGVFFSMFHICEDSV